MKPCLIIKAGEKIPSLTATPGDYEDWVATGMGLTAGECLVVAPYRGDPLPPHEAVSGVVVTGSGAMVTDGDEWIETCAAWLHEAVLRHLPLLGICFGHQLLAYALGGKVDYNPAGVEVGSVEITLQQAAQSDPLLGNLPDRFTAQLSHRQSVLSLPEGAKRLAHSPMEANQAFAVGSCAWGIQFHPEFDAAIISHYIESHRSELQQQGRDANSLLEGRRPSPESAALLARFATLLREAAGETC